MPLDEYGNYVSDPNPLWAYPPPNSICRVLSGHGVPDNAIGRDGSIYIDLDSSIMYLKTGGVWSEIQSGGGGAGEILRYTTTGPTADGVLPTDLSHEAIAVKPDGSTFTWDSTLHTWDDV